MEAVAQHDFITDRPDELPFRKGSVLHVINMDEEPSWYRARFGNREGLVPQNYLEMMPNNWFVPNCSRLEAEARLSEKDSKSGHYIQPDGAFILRHSENNPGQFSISVKEGVYVLHFRVFYEEPGSYFIWTSKFSSINNLINHHKTATIYGLRTLLLKDCVDSPTFGPVGMGARFVPKNNPTSTGNNNVNSSNNTQGPYPGAQQQQITRQPQTNNQQPVVTESGQIPPGLFPTAKAGMICEAMYDFRPGFKEEMGFSRGDRIRILAEEDENWWLGEIVHPETLKPRLPLTKGLFPSNYVRLLYNSGQGVPTTQPAPQGSRNWPAASQGMKIA